VRHDQDLPISLTGIGHAVCGRNHGMAPGACSCPCSESRPEADIRLIKPYHGQSAKLPLGRLGQHLYFTGDNSLLPAYFMEMNKPERRSHAGF
jgi:hypothetical protein